MYQIWQLHKVVHLYKHIHNFFRCALGESSESPQIFYGQADRKEGVGGLALSALTAIKCEILTH